VSGHHADERSGPLYTMRPTERFSGREREYAAYRPGYPRAAVEAMLEGFDRDRCVVVDVGAGTGISARAVADLLAGASRVVAVEPNAAMRAVAEHHPRVEWASGTAEATHLPDGLAHLIVCAQAFHWFRPAEALREFHRVLRPGGRLAVLWNSRDAADPATGEYGRLMREASGNHPAETRDDDAAPLVESPLFTGYRVRVHGSVQRLSLEGLLGRARSSSYCPTEGPAWLRLRDGLAALHADHAGADGLVEIRYTTRVHMVERAG
jgi:SAM-dependent methyltransferase